jgi:hypothetical protein
MTRIQCIRFAVGLSFVIYGVGEPRRGVNAPSSALSPLKAGPDCGLAMVTESVEPAQTGALDALSKEPPSAVRSASWKLPGLVFLGMGGVRRYLL